MQDLYDRDAPKKAANLSVNSSLLAEAKELKVNLSATLEEALELEVRKCRKARWVEQNKKAIENCNRLVEKAGLFSDKHRGF